MHLDVEIPADLAPLVSQGNGLWADCFATIEETETACRSVGFEVVEADYAPDARLWWEEYAKYDEGCQEDDAERRAIEVDGGRWISFGYVVAKNPSAGR
jgi:hypothetical protein